MSQQEQSTHQANEEALDHLREGHITALNDGNVNAWVGAFTADGVQMPPNAPANLGRESIRAWSQAF
jgi:ketosteroid isomerase-like protein